MLELLKNLVGLTTLLSAKTRAAQLMNEAESLEQAGQVKEALSLFEQASELGDGNATVKAAMMFLKGHGSCDWRLAAKYLEIAVEREIPNVHINIGMIYGIGGYGLKRNHNKAKYHLTMAFSVDGEVAAQECLTMLEKRKSPFGGLEVPRPKIPW